MLISLIASLLLFSDALEAGTTGKISGHVIDSKTKEPLIGVNVVVKGTSLGAATNIDGQYNIINVPPATYTVTASLLGYDQVVVNNVSVSIDLTTQLDFNLNETTIEQKEVVITAERPIVQKDLTATTAIVGREEIQALPVTEVSQVLQLQAGFVAGSLRGGRAGEVAYWIDGVPVTDPYNGSEIVEVNKNVVQEMQLVSGAFNAEYGQAMSGIVNIATREGGPTYSGSIGLYGGQYATSDTKIFPGLNMFKPTAIRNIEGNLNGPIIGDNLTFFANGRYIYFDGWLNGVNRFNPWNVSYTDGITHQFILARNDSGLADNKIVSLNSSQRWYAQGKLTWHVSPMLKVNGDYIFDHSKSKPYNQMYFYNPNGLGNDYNTSNTLILQLTHTLSNSTFYTLGLSYVGVGFQHYLYDLNYQPLTDSLGNVDPGGTLVETPNQGQHYVNPALFQTADQWSYYTGGTDMNWFRRQTITKLAKLDLSSQVDEVNLVKIGAEFRQHHLYLENIQLQPIQSQTSFDYATGDPFITTIIPPDTTTFHDMYNHNPLEFSAYLQDKLEFKDFILNIGVRFDYFNPDGYVLNDAHPDPSDPLHYMYTVDDPDIFTPVRDDHLFHADGTPVTLAERRTYYYKRTTPKSQFSPRLGASFPITAGGVVHFSYGHFFQIPRFERLYENPQFKISSVAGSNNLGFVGNADLEAEQTINGEIGVQQQLSEDIAVDVTAYMRDIRKLTGTRAAQIEVFGAIGSYNKYINSDFGTVKGIVLTLNKRFAGGISATVDYTYQVAMGTASDPTSEASAIAGGQLPEVQLVPLNWDQRHTLNVTAAYNAKNWGLSFIGKYGSGTPYTPSITSVTQTVDITSLLTNSQTKPSFFNLDARAFYEIPTVGKSKVVLYARVFNLLDLRNQVGVFAETGTAGFTPREEQIRELNNPAENVNTLDQWFTIPTYYSEPRRIEIGMNLEF